MAEIVERDRAEPLVKAMRAALTMRSDKTEEAVRVLDFAELRSLWHAGDLLREKVATEILRRGGNL